MMFDLLATSTLESTVVAPLTAVKWSRAAGTTSLPIINSDRVNPDWQSPLARAVAIFPAPMKPTRGSVAVLVDMEKGLASAGEKFWISNC